MRESDFLPDEHRTRLSHTNLNVTGGRHTTNRQETPMTISRRTFLGVTAGTAALAGLTACSAAAPAPSTQTPQLATPTTSQETAVTPTVVLVHGAFADSASWNDVAAKLTDQGHRVLTYANPLRGVSSDAAGLTDLVRSIAGPILLVGHSYGGAVMTNVPADAGDIIGLVYVAAFALDSGESAGDVAGSVPGSTLGDALNPVPTSGGSKDLYIQPDKFRHQFCADLTAPQASLMAITQRPITEAALGEASGPAPLWKTTPSWFIFGDQDLNIPVQAHRNMAQRANAVRTVEIPGASHVVASSQPQRTTDIILEASRGSA